jgi:[protein-PII] uridylyltransferase
MNTTLYMAAGGGAGDHEPGLALGDTSAVEHAPVRRAELAAGLATTRREFALAARQGHGGRATQRAYAARMDGIVRRLVGAASTLTDRRLVVCALGGYGRQTLCLHSDVDLMILFEETIGRNEERFVNAVLQPLWDLQLVVGHQIRELADFAELDSGNPEFLLALLDARPIAGDESLLEPVATRLAGLDEGDRVRAVDSLIDLIEHRHAQFNRTIYQLEPDIKNAPGGLRDLAALRYLHTLGGERFNEDRGSVRDAMAEAEDFLLTVRAVLHAESGRDANVLTHDLQERVSTTLECAGAGVQQRVEALMGAYFRSARVTAGALARALRRARPPAALPVTGRTPRHFEIAPEGFRFADATTAAERPSLWV